MRLVSRARRCLSRCTVVAIVVVAAMTIPGAFHQAEGSEPSVLASTPAVTLCGVASTSNLSYVAPPSDPVTTLFTNVSWTDFVVANGDLYVLTSTPSVEVYSLSGSLLSTISLPFSQGNASNAMVVDSSGNVYLFALIGGVYYLDKVNSSGSVLWSYRIHGVVAGMFAWHDSSSNPVIAVIMQNTSTGFMVNQSTGSLDTSGTEPPVPGGTYNFTSMTPNGGILSVAEGSTTDYVYEFNSAGTQTGYFGGTHSSAAGEVPGGPFVVGSPGFAAQIGSMIYLVDDNNSRNQSIDAFSTQGFYQGSTPNTNVSTAWFSPLQVSGSTVYFADDSNGGSIYSMSTSALAAEVALPQAPTQNGFGDALGMGAQVTTNATGGYYPSGSMPELTASFDPWWSAYASSLTLSYQIASQEQVVANDWPAATSVPLTSFTSSATALSGPLTIPSADQTPDVYEVNVDLIDTATDTTIGSTCATYSVGMPGDTLNLNTLASGLGSGGPAPVRGVELASEFGTNLFREQLDTSTLLPSCASPYTDTTTCGPSALDFSSYDPVTGQAAAEAAALGVTFEVQVAQGSALDTGLVNSGLWQADVQAIATHFATSAPDLTYFEAWNEPNDTWGSASTYVSQVLAPFYAGIQTANTATGRRDLVVGGTVVGSNLSYWQQIAAAGGFADLNVVGIHPYTGYDDSYEEDNIPVFLQDLKTLMSDNGAGSDPIFNTEQGWWSDGTAAFSDAAGWAASAFMWNKSLGITNWNYFMYEGSYTDGDGSFSLIQGADVDDYVKPDGIALMTVSNVLGGRHFIAMVPTGIPHTYAMEFGPSATSTSSIVAIWTDDLSTTADLSLTTGSATLPVTGTLGQASSLSVASGTQTQLGISGSPQYISVPSGSTLTIAAPESFGADLALAAGTKASASSAQSGKPASDSIRSTTDITGATVPDATSELGKDYGGWIANASDTSPTVSVTFRSAHSIDRVLVSTATLGSVMPGLRDYKVQLDEGWHLDHRGQRDQ